MTQRRYAQDAGKSWRKWEGLRLKQADPVTYWDVGVVWMLFTAMGVIAGLLVTRWIA